MLFRYLFPDSENEKNNQLNVAPNSQFNIDDYLYGYGKSQTYDPLSNIKNNQTFNPAKTPEFNPSRNFNQVAAEPQKKEEDLDLNSYNKFLSLQPKWNSEHPMRWQGIKKIFEDV